MTRLVATACLAIALVPQPSRAAGCDELLRETLRLSGVYVPAEQEYSRSFVFAMLVDCHGTKELVTVQRPTGHLPVCEARQTVEVVGRVIWNKALVDGHYEINSPSSVTCVPQAAIVPGAAAPSPVTTPVPSTPPASASTLTSRAEPSSPSPVGRETGSQMWVGRYRDSRGEGEVTFSLVLGQSTVSGTWRVRTGGGGPLTAVAEAGAGRFTLRMENTAAACPGTFEGWVEITRVSLVGAYNGKDCDGPVADGRLELHPR